MSDFRSLDDRVLASPQITTADVREAQERGIRLIINNRPEGESADQTPGPDIEAAARACGLGYVAIPVTQGGFSHAQIDAMADAIAGAEGPALAYCRSGTRSTFLWSLAQAQQGHSPDALSAAANRAGYDLTPIRPMLDMLASQKS